MTSSPRQQASGRLVPIHKTKNYIDLQVTESCIIQSGYSTNLTF